MKKMKDQIHISGIRPTNSPYLQIEYLIEKIVYGNIQYLFQLKFLTLQICLTKVHTREINKAYMIDYIGTPICLCFSASMLIVSVCV